METNFVVYDVETCPSKYMTDRGPSVITNRITLGVTYSNGDGYRIWQEANVGELIKYLLSFPCIVGFNILGYDHKVLEQYELGISAQLAANSLDLYHYIYRKTGCYTTLKSLAKHTLGQLLESSAEDSLIWWIQGKEAAVATHCKREIELTKCIYEAGIAQKEVAFAYNEKVKKVSVNWQDDTPENLSFVKDGVEITIDSENRAFFEAIHRINNGSENLFITGKAGTGKTTLLKYICASTEKNYAVLAPTGAAAIKAGGTTIFSFFKINYQNVYHYNDARLRYGSGERDNYNYFSEDDEDENIFNHFRYTNEQIEILRHLELLIIDEISMVRCEKIDVIDALLRCYRRSSKAFGGVQVVFIGDLFQLPPIASYDWKMISPYYANPYFFSSRVLQTSKFKTIELEKVYRQEDLEFVSLLNRIRSGNQTVQDLNKLNEKVSPKQLLKRLNDGYVVLTSVKDIAKNINEAKLDALPTDIHCFIAKVVGSVRLRDTTSPKFLMLKVGARVMMTANLAGEYHNGQLGEVVAIEGEEITVRITNAKGHSSNHVLQRYDWEQFEYILDEKNKKIKSKSIGVFSQFPIKLAWAITVHKSQGMTLDRAHIVFNNFSPPGIVYVALSRVKSFENLYLHEDIKMSQINIDPSVTNFYTNHIEKKG